MNAHFCMIHFLQRVNLLFLMFAKLHPQGTENTTLDLFHHQQRKLEKSVHILCGSNKWFILVVFGLQDFFLTAACEITVTINDSDLKSPSRMYSLHHFSLTHMLLLSGHKAVNEERDDSGVLS